MGLINELSERHRISAQPFLISGRDRLFFRDVAEAATDEIEEVRAGDVVALVGDFEPKSIARLLRLIDRGAIIVPLSADTRPDHEYFFNAAGADVVIDGPYSVRRRSAPYSHPMLSELRKRRHPGLILFSTGTTGRPKAILHDFENFLARFRTPRPPLMTLNFLLFDHIGGINTMLHTLFNRGTVVAPSSRTPQGVLEDIARHNVELLPTTPTFLRIMLMSGMIPDTVPASLKVITYGTERMDRVTLERLATLLPNVDFRQTYGMSELGILRVKSRARDSLWIKVGGEGVETQVVEGVLKMRAKNRMIGYLNAPSPFDAEGWYDTKDLVEQDGEWLRIVGRISDTISVGGIKVLPEVIERAALLHPDVEQAKACGVKNPITGQHIELTCQLCPGSDVGRHTMKAFLKRHLAEHNMPHRIRFGAIVHNHRFKSR